VTHKSHILIVDADPRARQAAARLLSEAGYVVSTSANGREGLCQAEAHSPALALIAADLPDLAHTQICHNLHDGGCFVALMLDVDADPLDIEWTRAEPDVYGQIFRPLADRPFLAQIRCYLRTQRALRERDAALAALQEANERLDAQIAQQQRRQTLLRRAVDLVPYPLFAKDEEGRFLLVNQAGAAFAGRPVDQVIGHLESEWVTDAEVLAQIQAQDRAVIEGGELALLPDVHYVDAQGRAHVMQSIKIPFAYRPGKWGVLGLAVDITARIEAEQALAASEELHRVTMDSIPDPVFITDDAGRFTFVCSNVKRTLGYAVEDILAMGDAATLLGGLRPDLDALSKTGELHNLERVIVDRAGQERTYLIDIKRVSIQAGTLLYACREITERVKAQEKLRALLREREALLREVHHRVKNNLQVICALLDLQADAMDDAQVRRALQQSQRRVRSMAYIHEQLTYGENVAQIDMQAYVEDLVSALSGAQGRHMLHFEVDAAHVTLPFDMVSPCGLLINELVSNAIQHAYGPGKEGTISVVLRPVDLDAGQIELLVSDDGVGLPDEVDLARPTTLGLDLVQLLVTQLDGTMAVDRVGGTTFRIRFAAQRN
jgi:PAS domain S-box-containing protein